MAKKDSMSIMNEFKPEGTMRNIIYTKSVLESGFEKRVFSSVKVLDIGCKNWFYANGENAFFKSFPSACLLHILKLLTHSLI